MLLVRISWALCRSEQFQLFGLASLAACDSSQQARLVQTSPSHPFSLVLSNSSNAKQWQSRHSVTVLAVCARTFCMGSHRPVKEVERSGDCCFPVGHNLNLRAQLYIEGIEQPDRPLQRYAKILVPLISGDLGLMHIESLGQVSL
jgi:hypothetical protein